MTVFYNRYIWVFSSFQNETSYAGQHDISTVIDCPTKHYSAEPQTNHRIPAHSPSEAHTRHQVRQNIHFWYS